MLRKSSLLIVGVFVLDGVSAALPACTTCPTGGIWSNWVDYTSCSKTCGLGGRKVQKRNCNSWNFGCPCTGVYSRLIPCAPTPCATGTPCVAPYKKYLSTTTKKYLCGNVTARADDYKAPTCTITKQLLYCSCPPGGLWTAWTAVAGAKCSATCGLCGTIAQKRTCRSTANGCPCTGPSTRNFACQSTPCPNSKCCSGYPLVTNLGTKKPQCGLQLAPDPVLPLAKCFCNKCNATNPPITIDTTSEGTTAFASVTMGVNARKCVTKTFKCTSTVEGFESVISMDHDANGAISGTPTSTATLTCNGAVIVRIFMVSSTMALDFMLIYKMMNAKRNISLSSELYLLAQIIANNVPYTFAYLICPIFYASFLSWKPIVSDIAYYVGNVLMFSFGQLFQGLVTVLMLQNASENKITTSRLFKSRNETGARRAKSGHNSA
ncbi:unnamed protein product, partial [Mesorhabditis belari]|uniref:Uncharacterized protein n=1 Tax=Mesorhabditis belari TaxID=2138241 RepID=A0AAF3FRS7_9BILA